MVVEFSNRVAPDEVVHHDPSHSPQSGSALFPLQSLNSQILSVMKLD